MELPFIKTTLQILFWKWSQKKMLKKNPLDSCIFFSSVKGLQSRNSDFNKSRLQEKCFPRSFWNSSETCQEEVYNEVILLKSQDYYLEPTLSKKTTSYISRGLFKSLRKLSVSSNLICLIHHSQLYQKQTPLQMLLLNVKRF